MAQQDRFDGFRATGMIQDKAQPEVPQIFILACQIALNTNWLGEPFIKAATPYWIIPVAPLFEHELHHPVTPSSLQAGASCEAVVRVVAALEKGMPFSARRA